MVNATHCCLTDVRSEVEGSWIADGTANLSASPSKTFQVHSKYLRGSFDGKLLLGIDRNVAPLATIYVRST